MIINDIYDIVIIGDDMNSNGKIIVIEGTDCSGKETQTRLLVEKLEAMGKKVKRISFPMYDTPTGKIIGACLLGKPEMCNSYLKEDHGFFPEGGGNVDSLAAIDLYAADRRYNLPKIKELLNDGYIVIIDRYVASNMAHRGGLLENRNDRLKIYKKIELLEYEINELPRPDKTILLYLPYEYACILKKNRKEIADETERNEKYLKMGEKAYLELSALYDYDLIECVKNKEIRTIEDINQELFEKIKEIL
jgi:dTMP kinase